MTAKSAPPDTAQEDRQRENSSLATKAEDAEPPPLLKFYPDAPAEASRGSIFRIDVTIESTDLDLEKEAKDSGYPTLAALAASFRDGDEVIISLSGEEVQPLTQAQIIKWDSRPIIKLAFDARMSNDAQWEEYTRYNIEVHNGDGLCLGYLELPIKCTRTPSSRRLNDARSWTKEALKSIRGDKRPPSVRALRYEHALLSYVQDDFEFMGAMANGLEINGTNVELDRTRFEPGIDWLKQFESEIKSGNYSVVFICWSSAAATKYKDRKSSIFREIELIVENAEKLRRIVPIDVTSDSISLPKELESLRQKTTSTKLTAAIQANRWRQSQKAAAAATAKQ